MKLRKVISTVQLNFDKYTQNGRTIGRATELLVTRPFIDTVKPHYNGSKSNGDPFLTDFKVLFVQVDFLLFLYWQ